jgi:hypothetical protein
METTYKMKEATNKQEAIISILDVMNHNAVWLNKCTSNLFATIYRLHTSEKREEFLRLCSFDQIKDLFIEIKKEYYNSIDWSNKF